MQWLIVARDSSDDDAPKRRLVAHYDMPTYPATPYDLPNQQHDGDDR